MDSASIIIGSEDTHKLNDIGLKAFNLKPYNLLSPFYLVCSSQLYFDWIRNGNIALKSSNKDLTRIIQIFQKKQIKKIIVRSSCIKETIDDRGKYVSCTCVPNVVELKKSIIEIFGDFKSNVYKGAESGIALIIQEYRDPKLQGHLSNERRIAEDKMNWQIEKQNVKDESIEVESIKGLEKANELDFSITKCLNARTLNINLKLTASWFSKINDNKRYHLEWLWDGQNFWILQIDIENEIENGSKPGSERMKELKKRPTKFSEEDKEKIPEVFESIDSTVNKWHKIECLKTFSSCRLPYWDIFILENDHILEQLVNGEIDISLKADLRRLIKSPITIRTDKLSNMEVLLPRSDTIFEYKDAVEFLIQTAKKLSYSGLKPEEFCFLIHHFIVSKAGALCLAKPNIDRVRIDSTWGIVEGLYYHPHDSFEVILETKKIKKKKRCKAKYIDVNIDCDWYAKNAGKNYDWKQSLSDKQILQLSNYTKSVANYLDQPVTVMFFINESRGIYPELLPWYYSTDEFNDKRTSYSEVIFSEKRRLIRSQEDFEVLQKDFIEHVHSAKRKIQLNLDIAIIRDIKLIQDIGTFAVENNFVVDIEGSILSHPYYLLRSKGVDVRCIDPLELSYSHREFYKLVRDRIPVKIENNQETVVSTKVSSEELIKFLKEKVVEEGLEMYWSQTNDNLIEEAADVLEVLRGTCKAYGIEFSEIEKIANIKREKRGGFDEGVVLIASKENSLFQLAGKSKNLFDSPDEHEINVKLKPIIKFFRKGDVDNFKSLTEISELRIPYINNYSSISNNFRYLLKDEIYNAIRIEYSEKEIIIKLENLENIEIDPEQLKILI